MDNHGSHNGLFPSLTGGHLTGEEVAHILGDNTVPQLSEAPGSQSLSSLSMPSGALHRTPSANATAPPVMGYPLQTPIQQTAEGNDAALRAYEYLSAQIQREMQTLREENASLEYRVAVFQQLFQNKERLAALLRSLGFNASVIDSNN